MLQKVCRLLRQCTVIAQPEREEPLVRTERFMEDAEIALIQSFKIRVITKHTDFHFQLFCNDWGWGIVEGLCKK